MNLEDRQLELLQRIEDGSKAVFSRDNYQNYLATMSRFSDYSYMNSILIAQQNPEASYLGGAEFWKTKFNRKIRNGEKGIDLVGFVPSKIEKDGAIKVIPQLTPIKVFDIAQTEGDLMPDLTNGLDGSIESYSMLRKALLDASPYQVIFEKMDDGKNGFFSDWEKKIVISDSMNQTQTIKELIHQITHVSVNLPDGRDARTKEIEAGSTAYVVCNHYDIDASDYKFSSLPSWSAGKDLDVLYKSLETIQAQASELIQKIDRNLDDLRLEKTPEQDHQYEDPDKGSKSEKTFDIYQMKVEESTAEIRGRDFDYLLAHNVILDREMYDKMYTAALPAGKDLDDVFMEFNINRPTDYTGHNLSVSDIIIVHEGDKSTAHYVDKAGYPIVKDFETEALTLENNIQEEQAHADEILDTVRFDNDPDLDRDNSKGRMGIRDHEKPAEPKMRLADRFKAAQEEADRRNGKSPSDRIEREVR